MPEHIVIPFGPRDNRSHRVRSGGTKTTRTSTHKQTGSQKPEQPQWNSTYVSQIHIASDQEVAGISFVNLGRFYKDKNLRSTLPNRLATLAMHEARGLLDRDICYGDQEVDPTVTQLRPSVEGLVLTALSSRRKLNWLMYRLPQGSNEDFEQLQALPDWLTVQTPQPE